MRIFNKLQGLATVALTVALSANFSFAQDAAKTLKTGLKSTKGTSSTVARQSLGGVSHNQGGTMSPLAMWDIDFDYDVEAASTNTSGLAGCVWTGTEFLLSDWSSDTLERFDATGNYLGFLRTGSSGTRAMTVANGTVYASFNSTTIRTINTTTGAATAAFTLPASVGAARWISYNPNGNSGAGSFWVGNWATDLFEVSHPASGTATLLNQIPAATHGLTGMYGAAFDGVSTGGPYLWVFNQGDPSGGASVAVIVQVDLTTGAQTGVIRDVDADNGNAGGLAGGISIATLPSNTLPTLMCVNQGTKFMGYELNFVFSQVYDAKADSLDPANGLTFWPATQNWNTLSFNGKVRNTGNQPLANIAHKVDLVDGSGNVVSTSNGAAVTLLPASSSPINSYGPFSGFTTNEVYTAILSTSVANDANTANDTTGAIFVVTDSTMARDYGSFDGNIGSLGIGTAANDNKSLGQVFPLNTATSLTSVSYYLSGAWANQSSSVSVYAVNAGAIAATPLATTGIYTTTQMDQDSGKLVTLSFATPVSLTPGEFFVAVNELGDSTLGMATSQYIYKDNSVFVKFDSGTGGAWTSVGDFGAQFERVFVLRPNFGTVVGIEDAGLKAFNVFPNPNKGSFTLSMNLQENDDVTISVLDINGKEVYRQNKQNVNMLNEQVELSLAAGVYVLQAKTSKGVATQRLVVE